MDLRPGIETLSMDGTCPREFLPGLPADDRRRVYYYCIFPNMMLSLHPDYMLTHTLWPIAADRTINVCEWHFQPSELARPGFDPADCVEFWDMTNKQDWYVCELSQAGIAHAAVRAGTVFEPRGSALRVRSVHRLEAGASRRTGTRRHGTM